MAGPRTREDVKMTEDPARRMRVRYLIVGAVLALLWVGHGGEPAWAHALRVGLVLVTVRPLVMLSRRYYARHWSSQAGQTRAIAILIAVRLLGVAAALIAGTLIEQLATGHSYELRWMIVLRFMLLLVTIPLQVRFLRSRTGAAALGRVRWNWLIPAKAALVLAALGAQIGLGEVLGNRADLVVAVGLLVTVALLGPVLHSRLFGARRTPSAAPPPADDLAPDATAASL
jgi:hypothetical protein